MAIVVYSATHTDANAIFRMSVAAGHVSEEQPHKIALSANGNVEDAPASNDILVNSSHLMNGIIHFHILAAFGSSCWALEL